MRNNDPSPSCQQPASYTPAYDGIYSIIQGGSGALSDSSSRGRLGLSPLSTSLYRGLLPRQPEAYLIGNAYSSKLFWDEARRFSLEMTGVKGDLTRMTRWANKLFDNIANVRATTHTDKQTIERIFRSCGSTPTLIYINGHTDMINDERLYLPSDCSANGSCLATLGIPFRTMREWLVDGENLMELTIVTDICKCTNIFGLPFVAEKRNGVWVWTETSESFADGAIDQWDGTKVLHFASTSEDENAHECESAGGIYTRAFSDVWPRERVTFGGRLDRIQSHMGTFFRQLADRPEMKGKPVLQQHHRVYSSYKLEFDDSNRFKATGIC